MTHCNFSNAVVNLSNFGVKVLSKLRSRLLGLAWLTLLGWTAVGRTFSLLQILPPPQLWVKPLILLWLDVEPTRSLGGSAQRSETDQLETSFCHVLKILLTGLLFFFPAWQRPGAGSLFSLFCSQFLWKYHGLSFPPSNLKPFKPLFNELEIKMASLTRSNQPSWLWEVWKFLVLVCQILNRCALKPKRVYPIWWMT